MPAHVVQVLNELLGCFPARPYAGLQEYNSVLRCLDRLPEPGNPSTAPQLSEQCSAQLGRLLRACFDRIVEVCSRLERAGGVAADARGSMPMLLFNQLMQCWILLRCCAGLAQGQPPSVQRSLAAALAALLGQTADSLADGLASTHGASSSAGVEELEDAAGFCMSEGADAPHLLLQLLASWLGLPDSPSCPEMPAVQALLQSDEPQRGSFGRVSQHVLSGLALQPGVLAACMRRRTAEGGLPLAVELVELAAEWVWAVARSPIAVELGHPAAADQLAAGPLPGQPGEHAISLSTVAVDLLALLCSHLAPAGQGSGQHGTVAAQQLWSKAVSRCRQAVIAALPAAVALLRQHSAQQAQQAPDFMQVVKCHSQLFEFATCCSNGGCGGACSGPGLPAACKAAEAALHLSSVAAGPTLVMSSALPPVLHLLEQFMAQILDLLDGVHAVLFRLLATGLAATRPDWREFLQHGPQAAVDACGSNQLIASSNSSGGMVAAGNQASLAGCAVHLNGLLSAGDSIPLDQAVARLQGMLPAAAALAAALEQHWQQPDQQRAAQLELELVLCCLRCANLRCSSVGFAAAQEGHSTKRCGGCRGPAYCSEGCQRAAWRGGHRHMCAEVAAALAAERAEQEASESS
ncbi:hypothetical protein ABPG75_006820 [Micractinium tetrahymenae]